MRLLVTGGAGYVGGTVAAVLIDAGHEVTVLDDLSTGHVDGVPDGARFVQLPVDRAGEAMAGRGFEAVLHFAAKSLVGESTIAPDRYWRANVGGTLALLDAMRAHDVGCIVFSSSAATYGEPESVPILETAPTRPTNPYGASKLAVDLALAGYAGAFGMAAVSLRYFNVAGAHGRLGERHATETHLIPLALQAASGQRPTLAVFGEDYPTPDGTCIRDYIHVLDLADAHVRALGAAAPGEHRIYNLGLGEGSSVRQVIDAVQRVTGRPVPHAVEARRAGDPAVLIASGGKARAELGWSPTRTLDDMVADAWAFHQSR